MRALELGAIDFIPKPVLTARDAVEHFAHELVGKLRVAAMARVGRRSAAAVLAGSRPARNPGPRVVSQKLIAIGASTGGTEAIREVLTVLPADVPGIVITQHMPPGFTASFAARLDGLCAIRVKEAVEGEQVLQGHAYIAPGGRHLEVSRGNGGFVMRVTDAEPVNRHKPSVEVLFRSVAKYAGARATGIMFTGMGADGAQAMREMRDAGAWNLVQDEATCVVFGMPREAIRHGAADEVVPLPTIARRLLAHLGRHA
jgi:two-component system chemotaxis response regulator CheB